jgi:hypothetical protein
MKDGIKTNLCFTGGEHQTAAGFLLGVVFARFEAGVLANQPGRGLRAGSGRAVTALVRIKGGV